MEGLCKVTEPARRRARIGTLVNLWPISMQVANYRESWELQVNIIRKLNLHSPKLCLQHK